MFEFPIAKTEALTLRVAPFSNTSHIVTWLTPHDGKLATVIKGAQRPRLAAAGEYDLGYRCELLFYRRQHQGLHVFRECAAIDRRRQCRGDWRRTAAISYVCHVVGVVTPDGAGSPELYALTDHVLEMVNVMPPPHDVLMLWFELHVMQLLGVMPRLDVCTGCRQRISPDADTVFVPTSGGTVCTSCAESRPPLRQASRLPAVLRLQLLRLQRTATFIPLRDWALNRTDRDALCRLWGHVLAHHLDVAPACRAVAYQMNALHLHPVPRSS